MAKQKSSFLRKVFLSIVVLVVLIMAIGAYLTYTTLYQPNVNLGEKKSAFIYIPTGSRFEDVLRILAENNFLKKTSTFEWLAEKKAYKNAVKPGRYRLLASMNNSALINLLKGGIQEPVDINFTGLHTVDQLVARVGRRLEADSASLYKAVHDAEFTRKYGFSPTEIQALFIPTNYQLVWNTSVDEFFDRVAKDYNNFWTEERKNKAKQIGFSQTEVSVLASIVQGEQCCDNEEKRIIAGLYINRLKKDMPLQSDPTVIFAIGNFSIQRVSIEQTRVSSPYNTYENKGLPPGPVGFAQASTLDAVLNYSKNDYLYMCAKENLSGKHNFAKSYEQHLVNRKKYREALNARNIHS